MIGVRTCWAFPAGSGALLLLAALADSAAAAPPQADPIGVIVDLKGELTVMTPGAAVASQATVGLRLGIGDRLVITPPAEATILYRSGRVERLTRSTILTAADPPRGEGLLTRTARTMMQLTSADVRMQPNRQGMIRPIPGASVAVAPRNDILVSTGHPTFTWTGVAGATEYRLQILPEGQPPSRFTPGRDTVWAHPGDVPPLAPGTYSWTVAAAPGGRPAAPQRFRVATPAQRAAVESALDAIRAGGLDPSRDGLLPAALAYREGGFLYDARDALARLAASVAVSREVHLLRAEVLMAIGDAEGAAAALGFAGAGPVDKD